MPAYPPRRSVSSTVSRAPELDPPARAEEFGRARHHEVRPAAFARALLEQGGKALVRIAHGSPPVSTSRSVRASRRTRSTAPGRSAHGVAPGAGRRLMQGRERDQLCIVERVAKGRHEAGFGRRRRLANAVEDRAQEVVGVIGVQLGREPERGVVTEQARPAAIVVAGAAGGVEKTVGGVGQYGARRRCASAGGGLGNIRGGCGTAYARPGERAEVGRHRLQIGIRRAPSCRTTGAIGPSALPCSAEWPVGAGRHTAPAPSTASAPGRQRSGPAPPSRRRRRRRGTPGRRARRLPASPGRRRRATIRRGRSPGRA